MEILDSVSGREPAGPSAEAPVRGTSLDRLELKREWVQQADEQQVEETMNLYAKAARQRMLASAPEPPEVQEAEETEEEREARSQQLKLQQKCQDIAALIMVEELEEEE